jgi:hypothetical protein
MIRAARIALLILGRSSGSGRTGRMMLPPNLALNRDFVGTLLILQFNT